MRLRIVAVCVLAGALTACATEPLGAYVEGGVGVVRGLGPVPAWAGPGASRKYDFNVVANPRGHVAVGYEWEGKKTVTYLEVRHESWLGTNSDSGEESVWAGGRWYPWRAK